MISIINCKRIEYFAYIHAVTFNFRACGEDMLKIKYYVN